MTEIVIPKATYAYLKHAEVEEEIWKSFCILQKWIKEAGYTKDPLDFKMDYCPDNSTSPHELYQRIV